MKFFSAMVLTALISFVACLFFPWWSIALAAFLVAALIHQQPGKAWLAGFLGLFILWTVLAIWKDNSNEGILSKRIAELFPLGGSSFMLIIVTGLIGALVAGMAALSASYFRNNKL